MFPLIENVTALLTIHYGDINMLFISLGNWKYLWHMVINKGSVLRARLQIYVQMLLVVEKKIAMLLFVGCKIALIKNAKHIFTESKGNRIDDDDESWKQNKNGTTNFVCYWPR